MVLKTVTFKQYLLWCAVIFLVIYNLHVMYRRYIDPPLIMKRTVAEGYWEEVGDDTGRLSFDVMPVFYSYKEVHCDSINYGDYDSVSVSVDSFYHSTHIGTEDTIQVYLQIYGNTDMITGDNY